MVMKLSEAIRLGSMLKPQGFGPTHNDGTHSCALTAALDAIGKSGYYADICYHFTTPAMRVTQPVSGEDMLALSAIRELNDRHRWTREQIADWIDTFDSAASVPQSVDAVDPVGVRSTP